MDSPSRVQFGWLSVHAETWQRKNAGARGEQLSEAPQKGNEQLQALRRKPSMHRAVQEKLVPLSFNDLPNRHPLMEIMETEATELVSSKWLLCSTALIFPSVAALNQ